MQAVGGKLPGSFNHRYHAEVERVRGGVIIDS